MSGSTRAFRSAAAHARDPAARGPDFVGIGAQKAGTTWIHERLRTHRHVWVPATKELHYFDSVCPHEELLGVEPYHHAGLGPKLRTFRNRPGLSTARWLRRFARREETADWYRSLFEPGDGQSAGEITPAYSTLDARGVRFARDVLPTGCRVFLVVRHPAQRTWSSLKMYYRWLERDPKLVSPEDAITFARDARNRLRTDYPRIVRTWREYFDEDFRVFLYDDLVESPLTFINEVCSFLGLAPFEPEEVPTERANADPADRSMPSHVRAALEDHFQRDVAELNGLVPGVARRWST